MESKNSYQFLIDCETTGLKITSKLLSFAGFVLNDDLDVIDTIDITIHYTAEELTDISEFSIKQHTKSGLLKKVSDSKISLNEAKKIFISLAKKYTFKIDDKIKKPILVNNTARMDYSWLENSFGTDFINAMDYRVIDISSINEMFKRYNPQAANEILAKKRWSHTSLADAEDSLMELREYKKLMFNK